MPTRDYLQKLVTCTLKTNKGIYYELYPTSNITDDNIEFYPISLISLCGIEIENISEEYLGKWELKAILNNPDIIQIQELEIRINGNFFI